MATDIATGGAIEVFRLVEDGEITPDEGIQVINYILDTMDKLSNTCEWVQIVIYLVIVGVVFYCLYKFIRLFF